MSKRATSFQACMKRELKGKHGTAAQARKRLGAASRKCSRKSR